MATTVIVGWTRHADGSWSYEDNRAVAWVTPWSTVVTVTVYTPTHVFASVFRTTTKAIVWATGIITQQEQS